MRLTLTFTALTGIVCLLTSATSAVASGTEPQHGFERDFDSAKERADEEQLPLLIHFQAFYCGPCRQMDSQVFSSGEVQQALGRDWWPFR